jgi:hypothetical protein
MILPDDSCRCFKAKYEIVRAAKVGLIEDEPNLSVILDQHLVTLAYDAFACFWKNLGMAKEQDQDIWGCRCRQMEVFDQDSICCVGK